jgi:signal transduction histidine kinase
VENSLASFKQIQPVWMADCQQQLAFNDETRQSLETFLQEFSGGIEGWLLGSDRDGLDAILRRWSERTQTDLENPSGSLVQIIQQLYGALLQAARRGLAANEALNLVSITQPFFIEASQQALRLEIKAANKHLTSELEQTHRNLEKLDRSKSDFIAIAAHELKTPLTLIEGYLAMLRERLVQFESSPEHQVLFTGMTHGARRLRQIVDDMVDVSLIDNQLLSLNFQPMWLNRLFEGLEHEVRRVLVERRLSLEIQPFPGSQEMIFGDEARLYQVFRNLLANAIKYTPDGGNITICGKRLPGFVDVMVKDTGIGISPENQTIIFEKFGRLGEIAFHTSNRTGFKGGGPGLGLSIARGIVNAHGGAIWVESDGCDEIRCPGSIFHVLLPLRTAPPDDLSAKLFDPLSSFERARGKSSGNHEEIYGKKES